MEEIETWKSIAGYEGIYEVSNCGNVKSLNYRTTGNQNLLSLFLTGLRKRRYRLVHLSIAGKAKKMQVHRLVAMAFVPNPENLPCVNHIDNDPLNNHATNLEWCTVRYNTSHGYGFRKTSSKYTGVIWFKNANKWRAKIRIKGKDKYLGYYENEIDASIAYQTALSNLKD